VAVSISAGVAQITSAYPELFPYRVWISVAAVFLIMLINLRGVKESGIAFSIPTYFFIVMLFVTVGTGLIRHFTGTLGAVIDPPHLEVECNFSNHALFTSSCILKRHSRPNWD
jgi:amino acid transporter